MLRMACIATYLFVLSWMHLQEEQARVTAAMDVARGQLAESKSALEAARKAVAAAEMRVESLAERIKTLQAQVRCQKL